MKKFTKNLSKLLVISLITVSSGLPCVKSVHAEHNTNSSEKEIIIKFKEDERADETKKEISKKLKVSKMNTKKKLYENKAEVLEIGENDDITAIVEELRKNSNVLYAQPNYKLTTYEVPADENFNQQWGLQNIGQTINGQAGNNNVDINAVNAWNITRGNKEVVIGILDTGIDIKHSDLKDSIFVNSKEVPGNGLDDDHNGFIDDNNGWDFINNDNTVYDSYTSDSHGTHIGGIIAAPANSQGIVGVAPEVKILPLKIFNGNSGYTSDAIEAIEYAEKMGVTIINCSWGSSESNEALKDAIEQSNMLFVCAAGNNSSNNIVYPAAYQMLNIISVGAIDNVGNLAAFSNYGDKVQVAAPGVNILSTLPGNTYGMQSGTSMSTAFVTGVAALIRSQFVDITSEEIKSSIESSVAIEDNLENYISTSGRIDANATITNVTDKENKDELMKDNSAEANGKIQKPLTSVKSSLFKDSTKFPSNIENNINSSDSTDTGVYNIKIMLIKKNMLSISWITNECANSEVYYGKTKDLDKKNIVNLMGNRHQLYINDFNSDEYKYFKIRSVDENGKIYETDISKIEEYIESNKKISSTKIKEKKSSQKSSYNDMEIQALATLSGNQSYEIESNDDYTNANYVNIDITNVVNGTISWFVYDVDVSTGDNDWYQAHIVPTSGEAITLKDISENNDYDIEVYDNSLNLICGSYRGAGYSEFIDLYGLGFLEGDYYIRIYPFYVEEISDTSYTLSLRGNGNVLQDNVSSTTIEYSEEHWFYFYANKTGKFSVSLGNIEEGLDYDLQIYDLNGNLIGGSYNRSNSRELYQTIISEPKGYYIRVYSYIPGCIPDFYWIKARVTIPDSYEMNDNYSYSKQVNVDSSISGTIDTENDKDFYKVVLDKSSNITVKLKNIPSTCDYGLILYNSSLNIVGSSNKMNNNDEEIKVFLQTGTYYVQVYSSNYSYSQESKYELMVNGTKKIRYVYNNKNQLIEVYQEDKLRVKYYYDSNGSATRCNMKSIA